MNITVFFSEKLISKKNHEFKAVVFLGGIFLVVIKIIGDSLPSDELNKDRTTLRTTV